MWYKLCIHSVDTDTCNEASVKLKALHIIFHTHIQIYMYKYSEINRFEELNYTNSQHQKNLMSCKNEYINHV